MPGFDGTGPRGQGPMTGWGAGYCGSGTARRAGGAPGYGRGRGGFGRGWRNRYFATGLPGWMRDGYGPPVYDESVTESQVLKDQAQELQRALQAIEARLETLEKKNKPEE